MIKILPSFFLFILGAIVGSFCCCQVWRIRKNDKSKRSHCMHCRYQLRWYDNVPIFSWLSLGGKCRKCRKKIGITELLAEIFTGVVFLTTYLFWPYKNVLDTGNWLQLGMFVVFLATLSMYVIMFIFDAKWKELPVSLLYASMVTALIFKVLECIYLSEVNYLTLGGSLLILPLFYFLMYKISGEKWVGGGDWMLCVSLALILGDFWLSTFVLFISNLLGSFVMLPVIKIKKNKKIMIPFGPFLIAAFLLVFYMRDLIFSLVMV